MSPSTDAADNQPGPESHTSDSIGIIREVSTVPTNLTGRNVEASEEEPRYEVCQWGFCFVPMCTDLETDRE